MCYMCVAVGCGLLTESCAVGRTQTETAGGSWEPLLPEIVRLLFVKHDNGIL